MKVIIMSVTLNHNDHYLTESGLLVARRVETETFSETLKRLTDWIL